MAQVATRESTIDEYVEDYRNLNISFDSMHLKEKVQFTPDSSGVTEGILLGDEFIQKYKNDLKDIVVNKTFTQDEFHKYKCNPWALSYDEYDSVEFWFLILELNDLYSATDFTKKTIKLYDRTLPDVVDTILAAEEPFIDANIDEIDGLDETDINESDDDNDIEEDM